MGGSGEAATYSMRCAQPLPRRKIMLGDSAHQVHCVACSRMATLTSFDPNRSEGVRGLRGRRKMVEKKGFFLGSLESGGVSYLYANWGLILVRRSASPAFMAGLTVTCRGHLAEMSTGNLGGHVDNGRVFI